MKRAAAALIAVAVLGAALLLVACDDQVTTRAAMEHDMDNMATMINGSVPPNTPTFAFSSLELSRRPSAPGMQTVIEETIRKPGTRAPIHTHDFAGTTCVVSGEMTLYLEGSAPAKAPAGTCYFMPPGHLMTGVNSGATMAVMHDIFTVPTGDDVWTLHEPGFER